MGVRWCGEFVVEVVGGVREWGVMCSEWGVKECRDKIQFCI